MAFLLLGAIALFEELGIAAAATAIAEVTAEELATAVAFNEAVAAAGEAATIAAETAAAEATATLAAEAAAEELAAAEIEAAAEAEFQAIVEGAEGQAEAAIPDFEAPEGIRIEPTAEPRVPGEVGYTINESYVPDAEAYNIQADLFNDTFEAEIEAGEFSGMPYYDVPDGITFLEEPTAEGFNLDVTPWRDTANATGFTPNELLKGLSDAGQIATAITTTGTTIQDLVKLYRETHAPPLTPTNSITKDGTIIDPFKIGYDLGLFMTLSEKYISRGYNELDSFAEAVKENPELLYLIETVYDFEHNETQQNVDQFLESESAYNGKSLDPSQVYTKKVGDVDIFCIVDELGVEQCYTGTRGNTPTVWGTYCGPFSPNDKAPVTLLDLYCMQHDISIDANGFFDTESDKQLLNRIRNNYDRMEFTERQVARGVFLYFATIGYSLSILKTSIIPDNVDEKVTNVLANDIFFQLSGSQSGEARTRFYQGLRTGLTKNFHIMDAPEQKATAHSECFRDLPIVWIR